LLEVLTQLDVFLIRNISIFIIEWIICNYFMDKYFNFMNSLIFSYIAAVFIFVTLFEDDKCS